jgi:CTP synthase (UTP-ammonia lyase)
MKSALKIALVGDYDETITAHSCIPKALSLSAESLNAAVQPVWVPTTEIKKLSQSDRSEFDGIWCVPGSPYQDRAAVLELIRYARTSATPYLGTCGGYQHAILEFAINELGYKDADLEEENPKASMPLISALSCRLTDESRKISISKDSKLHLFLEQSELSEEYRCGFGMNPRYKSLFDQSSLRFVAFNEEKIPQAFEVTSHPFFIGTAFQPERSARRDVAHPLVSAFVRAMHLASLNEKS